MTDTATDDTRDLRPVRYADHVTAAHADALFEYLSARLSHAITGTEPGTDARRAVTGLDLVIPDLVGTLRHLVARRDELPDWTTAYALELRQAIRREWNRLAHIAGQWADTPTPPPWGPVTHLSAEEEAAEVLRREELRTRER